MVSYVCLAPISGHQAHLKVRKLALTVNIHVSTKTCVTGNNFILHKALPECCIPSMHVISNFERRLKFSRYSYNSCRRPCRLQLFEKRSESERKGNWLFRPIRKGFGKRSESVREKTV